MSDDLRIERAESAQAPGLRELARRLARFNEQHAGAELHGQLFLLLKDGKGEVRGGGVAFTSWRWLNIDVLWVDREFRGLGHGAELLRRLEGWGQEQGCGAVLVDTFSFQSEGFYVRCGYQVFGRLPDYPPGSERVYLHKTLPPAEGR